MGERETSTSSARAGSMAMRREARDARDDGAAVAGSG